MKISLKTLRFKNDPIKLSNSTTDNISHIVLIRYPRGIRKYKMILMLAPSSLPVYHFSKLMQRENVKWLFSCQCFFQHKARSRIFPEKKRQKLSSSIAKTIVSLYLLLLSYMSQVMLRMSYLVIYLYVMLKEITNA